MKDTKYQINITLINQLPDGGSLMKDVSNLMTNLWPDVDIEWSYLFSPNLNLLMNEQIDEYNCVYYSCVSFITCGTVLMYLDISKSPLPCVPIILHMILCMIKLMVLLFLHAAHPYFKQLIQCLLHFMLLFFNHNVCKDCQITTTSWLVS